MKTKVMALALAVMVISFGVVSAQEIVPPAVYVNMEEVTGADANGYIDPAALPVDLVIPVRFLNNELAQPGISNGYKFTGTATYEDIAGAWNPAYPWDFTFAFALMQFPPYFDFGIATIYILPDLFPTLVTQDAMGMGFGGASGPVNGIGLPAFFNGIAYTITLSDISGAVGDQIIMDTTWWQPGNYWLWTAIPDPGPSWSGPYVFEIGTSDVAVVEGAGAPGSFSLSQNYPNPFNPTTTVAFNVPHRSNVEVVVYNILGQPVKTLVNEELAAGSYTADWDGTSDAGKQVASGVYLCNMQAGEYRAKITMIMVK